MPLSQPPQVPPVAAPPPPSPEDQKDRDAARAGLRIKVRIKLVSLKLNRKYDRRLERECEKLKRMADISRDLEDGGAFAKRVLEVMNHALHAKSLEEAQAALDLTAALAPFDGVPIKAKASFTKGRTGATAADLELSAFGAGKKVCKWRGVECR